MAKQKINVAVGRFQPFTLGHLNMVNEGGHPCIVYQMLPPELPDNLNDLKIKSSKAKPAEIKNVLNYITSGGEGSLTEREKELLKRPFTGSLIEKEMEIVKRSNKNILDVVYVKNAFEGIARFNKFILDNQDEYEPVYWLCGDDRKDEYQNTLDKYIKDKPLAIERGGKEFDNVISDIQIYTGKGRTDGVSGTAVRLSIIQNDKGKFAKIMPAGVNTMFDDFAESFKIYTEKLQSLVKESMQVSLREYLLEVFNTDSNTYIMEGGAGGHMAHPFDYTEFTGEELLELVDSLFGGKIENVKEKLDGCNLNATMNDNGDVVFIRGKQDLNNEYGGMSIEDMAKKWADKPGVRDTFLTAGEIISKIFPLLGKKYFNPDPNTRKVINCECIMAGKTNVMPYPEDRVAFHGYKIFKRKESAWEEFETVEGNVDDIYKAAANMDSARPRANLIIKSVEDANKFANQFKTKLTKLFKAEGLTMTASIEEWKRKRFEDLKPEWLTAAVGEVFNRWFNDDKSFSARELKKLYPDHYDEVKSDKFAKPYITKVMEPMDDLFLEIGNAFIKLCDGFTNQGSNDQVINMLKKDVEDVVNQIEKEGSDEVKTKLEFQMNRLKKLGEDSINATEGVVFTYKGKLMKLTGCFAPLNQILGTIKFSK